MFATVDSPGARFVRIYLVTENEEIAVLAPKELREFIREIRTVPTLDRITELATTVYDGVWVRLRMESAVEHYRQLMHDNVEENDRAGTLRLEAARKTIDFEDLNFVRMLAEAEEPNNLDEVVDFDSVRVETWRYTYDMSTRILGAKKISEDVIASGSGAL